MTIILDAHHDKSLKSKISPIMAVAQKSLDDQWTELFADLDIPPATISAIRHVALAAFRGFALRQLQSATHADWSHEREILVKMLSSALEQARVR